MEEVEKEIFIQALINAVKHDGKADYKIVISKLAAELPELRPRLRELAPLVQRIVEQVNSLSPEEQKSKLLEARPSFFEEERKTEAKQPLPPLPGTEKEVMVKTRFAPNPDFLIHLGNARPAILSYEYARMYNGKMILRFEDTDPRTKTPLPEAYGMIREDLRWLGIKWDEEYVQSLRMEIYYEVARRLIEKGGAYVDDLSKKEYLKLVESGKPHPNRDKPAEYSLELFDRMLEGHYGEGEAVLRVKTLLSYRDRSLIDWVAFRIIDTSRYPHPLTGSKYIVWPTYNFASAVDDYMMGVTHILRGKEHKQNTIKQHHLYQHMGWRQPYAIHLGRLKLEGFVMSKSLIKTLLHEKTGEMIGPDDPRFATIRGLRRRGISSQAIRKIIMSVGAKKTDASISYANLASANRSLIDEFAPRIMFVDEPVFMEASLPQGCIEARIPFHPDNRSLGSRTYRVCDGDVIAIPRKDYSSRKNASFETRLLGLGNFSLNGQTLTFISESIEDARRKGLKIIQWVPFSSSLKATLYVPLGEKIDARIGYIEKNDLLEKYVDKTIQLVRIGFARLETLSPLVRMIFAHD